METHGVSFSTERLIVRTPRAGDGMHYARYYTENREFLQPWSPTFGEDMFSAPDWEDSIPIIRHEFASGRSARFCLFHERQMIGVANITSITRSPGYSCVLGYTLCKSAQGKGLMGEALTPILDYMLNDRNLHRVTAGYMPHNQRSGKLLRTLGFQVEGYARDYLLIDGVWQDHVLTALRNENWKAPGSG
jgi:ribosomal-protein-alanine N-acetyltransferase